MIKIPQLTPVTSSNIASIGHDGTHTYVKFKSGGVWRYPTSAEDHSSLATAESIGKHFHANIKSLGGEKVE